MTTRISKLDLSLIATYLLLISAIAFGLFRARSETLRSYAGPEGKTLQDEWTKWRSDVASGETDRGLVKRRVPKSTEPPMVVLMREHFAVCLTAGIALTSILYAFFAFVLRGMFTATASLSNRGNHSLGDRSRGMPS